MLSRYSRFVCVSRSRLLFLFEPHQLSYDARRFGHWAFPLHSRRRALYRCDSFSWARAATAAIVVIVSIIVHAHALELRYPVLHLGGLLRAPPRAPSIAVCVGGGGRVGYAGGGAREEVREADDEEGGCYCGCEERGRHARAGVQMRRHCVIFVLVFILLLSCLVPAQGCAPVGRPGRGGIGPREREEGSLR